MEFYQASTKKTKCGTSQEKRRNTDVSIVNYMDLLIKKKIKKKGRRRNAVYIDLHEVFCDCV